MNGIKNLYHRIPYHLRYRIGHTLWTINHFFRKYINPFFPQVYIFEGHEKNSGAPLAFAYAGAPCPIQEYWAHMTLEPGFQKHAAGRHFFLNVPSILKQHSSCSFLLMEKNPWSGKYLQEKPGFHVPCWVDMKIDVSDDLDAFHSSQGRSIKSRIAKNRLKYRVTREKKYFDEFYHHMYLPHVRGRHSSSAEIHAYAFLSEIFSQGELLLVEDETQVLGGILFFKRGQDIKCQALGVRDGNWEFVEKGAIGACYYFLMNELQKRGVSQLYIGGTRPFLSDGVTKFKTAIKAQFVPNPHNSDLWLALINDSLGLRSFLTNNSFVCVGENNELYRAMFIQTENQPTPDEISRAACHSLGQGLRGICVVVFGALSALSDKFYSGKVEALHIKTAGSYFGPLVTQ